MKGRQLTMALAGATTLFFCAAAPLLADLNYGLVAHYPFNGNPNDATHNGHDGANNGATPTADRFAAPNSAYDFDGTDYINLNANRPLVGSQQALTIAAWFYPRSTSAGNIYIHRADFRDVLLYWSPSDTLSGIKWELPSAHAVWHAVRSGTLPLSQWSHCVGTYDGSVQKLYINGILAGSDNWVGSVDFDSGFYAEGIGGKSSDSSYMFNGKIDDVRIYNRALSEQEIQQLAGLAQVVTFTVVGTSDPWLAGMPDGSTASGVDSAPAQSPVLVVGLPLLPGSALTFTASGAVRNGPGAPTYGPDGNASDIDTHREGAQNGMSNISAPDASLVGVFLGPEQPDISPAPGALDFSASANRDYLSITPFLKQVFFIGDGKTSANQVQMVVVPPGATRLYLCTMDKYEWKNNGGYFNVGISSGSLVSNVRASQKSGTKLVDIWYDLTNPSGSPLNVTVAVSTNNGATFDLPASSFSGSGYGSSVVPGNSRQIVWDAGADWNGQFSSQVKFRVTATGSTDNAVSINSPSQYRR